MLAVPRIVFCFVALGLAWLPYGADQARAQPRISIDEGEIRVDAEGDEEEGGERPRSGRRSAQSQSRGGSSRNDASATDSSQDRVRRFIDGRSGGARSRVQYPGQPQDFRQEEGEFENLRDFQDRTGRGPSNDRGDGSRARMRIGNWTAQFGNKVQPFSSNWYEAHPDAWRHDQPQVDVWATVPSEGVASWLGWEEAAPNGARLVVPGRGTVRRFEPSRFGNWLPLGVFMIMSSPDDNTRLVQLAVDRSGNLRGVYYDAITDGTFNVSGRMFRDNREAQWSLRTNRNVTFRARLSDLLSHYGRVRVNLPGGTQRWDLVRVER